MGKESGKKSKKRKSARKPLFVHLRVHSAYSLLEGAIKIPDLVELCAENNMPAVAITDTTNLFGSLEFSLEAAKNGVQPIIGSIVKIITGTDRHGRNETSEMLLLAKNQAGYQNLLKIISESFRASRDNHHPSTQFEMLEKYSSGLIALTGGKGGILGRAILGNQIKIAEDWLKKLHQAFADNLYIELQRHGLEDEKKIEQPLIDLAYKYNIPLVATNDVYFSEHDMYEAHDALICIADGRYVSEQDRRRFTPEHYFKTAEEMSELFSDIPEATQNTLVIAKRCAIMSQARDPMLPDFPTEEGRSQEEELRKVAKEGLQKRLEDQVFKSEMSEEQKKEIAKPYWDRIDYELDVITSMKFSGYFLIVSDFISWSKDHGVPVGPGRGSGAGSVVAWALRITNLDPLRFGLLFERFLNPERVSMPDFDIDFCQERRDEAIRYVQEKYGRDRVAQIITFGKLQARAVLRDVGRVLQMPYGQVDDICKMIPFNPIQPIMLADAIEMDPKLQQARTEDEQIGKLIDIGLKLEGLYRHASTHAAGVVIGDRPLDELIPVYYDQRSEMPITGYSMKMAETSGLVKFDFLGLKTLTVIDRTCQLLRESGVEIDIDHLDFEDKATFEMLSRGDTTGVFQMESSGMRDALRKMKPDSIEDIIALISLYRPGPMENIPTYIARKHGKEKPDYLHPKLESVLEETFGVIIYQEQVMQIAQVLAGYSLGSADLLRRAMGKKIKAEMDAQRDMFVEGAIQNSVTKSKATHIFDLVAKFAGYGFNKSHAAAYAVIGYQTAYLKANYPVEFLTASMNIDIGDTDKINTFRLEALRSGITILPPDINKSGAYFVTEKLEKLQEGKRKRAIRYALGAIKNVGIEAMKLLLEERNQNGPFKDIFDIAHRCDNKIINKRQIESLVKSGSLDSLWKNRRQLFESASLLTRYNQAVVEEKTSNQSNLFGGFSEGVGIPLPILPNIDDWSDEELLANECDAIGFYLSAHPLDKFSRELEFTGVVPCNKIEERISSSGNEINIAGVVTSTTHRATGGRRFAYIILSDPSTSVEISIFNEALISECRDLIEGKRPLLISVDARKDEGGIRLFANRIVLLEEYLKTRSHNIRVHLENTRHLENISNTLKKATTGQGNCRILLIVKTQQNMQVEIALPGSYPLHQAILSELGNIESIAKLTAA